MTLEWRQLPAQDISYVSECRRYAVGYDGQHKMWRSYRLAPGGPWFAVLGQSMPTEGGAKAQCEADAQ
jgi:hypothetical protein